MKRRTRRLPSNGEGHERHERRSLLLAAGLLLALVLAAVYPSGGKQPEADALAASDPRIVEIRYRVDRQEWGRTRPLLCRIVHHYGLGDHAAEATLYLNGRSGRCAPANRAVAAGETVRIAVWAAPGFDPCPGETPACPGASEP